MRDIPAASSDFLVGGVMLKTIFYFQDIFYKSDAKGNVVNSEKKEASF